MPFQWDDYLRLAEELATRQGDEAAERSAISRAYYAALGRAADLLRSEGRSISPRTTHGDIWRAFKNSSDARRVEVGQQLDALRQLRNRADYDSSFNGDPTAVARDAATLARRVLDALDEVRSGPI